MRLYNYDTIIEALANSELSPGAFATAKRAIENAGHDYIVRDCTGCMGASFGDCDTCERIVKVAE